MLHIGGVEPIELRPLLELPLAEVFEMPEGLDTETESVLARVADAVEAHGGTLWFGSELVQAPERWVSAGLGWEGAVEIELLIRSWCPANWRGGVAQRLWQARLTVGVDCECQRDHGMHYVYDLTSEVGSLDGLLRATDAHLAQVARWREEDRDATAWRTQAGLSQPPVRGSGR